MKVVVTGATGFVGSHLARSLLDAGYAVVALYRSRGKLAALDGLDVQAVQGDLDDVDALRRACQGCQVLFHVAAKADYWKDDDKAALWRINVDGTRNVLDAARVAGIQRVIVTSSASTIGIRPDGTPADESVPFNLPPDRFWYAYTKLKAEQVVADYVADGLDAVILNPSVILGPGDLNAISGSFIIQAARLQWALPVTSGGIAIIDARDVAQAHVNAIERGRVGQRYILSSANVSYAAFFKLMAEVCGWRAPLFSLPDMMLEPTARALGAMRRLGIRTPVDANQTRLGATFAYFDGGKAQRELYRPRINMRQSVHDTWQWYRERGYIQRDLLSRLIDLF